MTDRELLDLAAKAARSAMPERRELTDDQIDEVWENTPDCRIMANYEDQRKFARLAIAADRALNQVNPLNTTRLFVLELRGQYFMLPAGCVFDQNAKMIGSFEVQKNGTS